MRRQLLAVILAAVVVAGGVGLATAQSTPTVGVDAPDSVAEGSTVTADLEAADVTDPEGVGSFTVEVSYDPAVVSVSATGTSTFDVSTSRPSPGVLRIVGYTGEYPGPGGDVRLAALQVTGEAVGTSALDVTVETLTDADGDDLAYATGTDAIDVEESSSDGGGTGDPGHGGSSDSGSGSGTGTATATPSGTEETPADGTPAATDGGPATPGGSATESPGASPTGTAEAEPEGLSGFGAGVALLAVLLGTAGLAARRRL